MISQFLILKNKICDNLPFFNKNKVSVKGLNKTNKEFIDQITNISRTRFQLIDNLDSLNIFSEISNNLIVTENKNKFSFVAKDKDKNVLSLKVPNIFGKGENVTVNYSSIEEYDVKIAKPMIFKDFLLFLKIENRKFVTDNLVKNKTEFSIGDKRFNIGYGFPNYLFFRLNSPTFSLNIKQGCKFTKFEGLVDYTHKLFLDLNYNVKISAGHILGKIEQDEIFIRNKKETATYMKISNKMFYNLKFLNIYTYHEMNISKNIIRNDIDNNIGAGFSIPLYKNKDKPCIDLSVKIPLNKGGIKDLYQFSYEVTF